MIEGSGCCTDPGGHTGSRIFAANFDAVGGDCLVNLATRRPFARLAQIGSRLSESAHVQRRRECSRADGRRQDGEQGAGGSLVRPERRPATTLVYPTTRGSPSPRMYDLKASIYRSWRTLGRK